MKSRKTTFEERLEIVKWVIENDMSYKDAADKYSINYALVYKWTRAYIDKGSEALKYDKRGPKTKSEIDENNLTEVEKLKLELEKEIALRKRREFELEVFLKKEEFEKKLRFRK
jgi:transposase-like protein